MKILALEFSSPQRSVALIEGPGGASTPLVHRQDAMRAEEETPGKPEAVTGAAAFRDLATLAPTGRVIEVVATGHTGTGLGLIEAVLEQAGLEREQVDCVAIGIGPGSYTGIRSAIAVAQGWQLALDKTRLLAISSAECIAAQARAEGFVGRGMVVIDAQRQEFYLADYEITGQGIRETKRLRLASRIEAEAARAAGNSLMGPEVTNWFSEGRLVFPRAAMLAQLALARGDYVSAERIEPLYLREPQFVKSGPSAPK